MPRRRGFGAGREGRLAGQLLRTHVPSEAVHVEPGNRAVRVPTANEKGARGRKPGAASPETRLLTVSNLLV